MMDYEIDARLKALEKNKESKASVSYLAFCLLAIIIAVTYSAMTKGQRSQSRINQLEQRVHTLELTRH